MIKWHRLELFQIITKNKKNSFTLIQAFDEQNSKSVYKFNLNIPEDFNQLNIILISNGYIDFKTFVKRNKRTWDLKLAGIIANLIDINIISKDLLYRGNDEDTFNYINSLMKSI